MGAADDPATEESMKGDSSNISLLAIVRPTRDMYSSQNCWIFGAATEGFSDAFV